MCTHSRKIYTARFEVQIHQIKRDSALQVTMDPGECYFTADVSDAKVGQMRLGDRLVDRFVLSDPTQEIPLGFFTCKILIVRVSAADFEGHVSGDDGWIVAYGFQKYNDNIFLFSHARLDLGSVRWISFISP